MTLRTIDRGRRRDACAGGFAGLERLVVLNRREQRPFRVEPDGGVAGFRVDHGQLHLGVRQTTGEDPEVLVQTAAVEQLDDHLDVGRIEEPEGARVLGQLH